MQATLDYLAGWAAKYKDLLTLVLSITVLVSSLITLRITSRRAVRPVLVFEFTDTGWVIRNVGTGAALNVIIAHRSQVGENGKRQWIFPVRVPPIAKDDSVPLTWCSHENEAGLGATYTDAFGSKYTTTCGRDLNRFTKRWKFDWPEKKVTASWDLPHAQSLLELRRGVRLD